MEKVQAIITKLQEQMQQQAPAEHLLITAQMLVSSLQTIQQTAVQNPYRKVVVTMPNAPVVTEPTQTWVQTERTILQRPEVVVIKQQPTETLAEKIVMPVIESIEPITINEQMATVTMEEIAEPIHLLHETEPAVESSNTLFLFDNENVEEEENIVTIDTTIEQAETAMVEQTTAAVTTNNIAAEEEKVVFEIEPIALVEEDEVEEESIVVEMEKPVEKPAVPSFNREALAAFANVKIADIPSFTSIPTMAYQSKKQVFELNEVLVEEESECIINNRYRENTIEVAQVLENTPIKDLKKAIGVNDRFKFINELFRGDEAMYERSLKTIQNYSILPEAIFWMDRELKTKLGWELDNETAYHFYALVKRRFS